MRNEIENNYVHYNDNEKVRIVFIFQIPSSWVSVESLYDACMKDVNCEVRLLLLREHGFERKSMQGAEDFLISKKIRYTDFDEFDLEGFRPHYVIYNSPYEMLHRFGNMRSWSAYMKFIGSRVVYIPYGIEFVDTEEAHWAHFGTVTILNAYRIYTMSKAMQEEYFLHCSNAEAVQPLGLPRFDAAVDKERYPILPELRERSKGRKLIIWKVHFVKRILIQGDFVQVTPYLEEYLAFIDVIKEHPDLFFVFLPHPKFCEDRMPQDIKRNVISILEQLSNIENVYIDYGVDYHYSFLHGDAIIIDRSSLMVEAGLLGVPVLYMENPDYREPLTKPIEDLASAYERGTCCKDMAAFVDRIAAGQDERKSFREDKVALNMPHCDGFCGERIKESLMATLKSNPQPNIKGFHRLKGNPRILVWGTGEIASKMFLFLQFADNQRLIHIVGYADNDTKKWDKRFYGHQVFSPDKAVSKTFDYVVLAVEKGIDAVASQLHKLGVDENKIIFFDEFLVKMVYQSDR